MGQGGVIVRKGLLSIGASVLGSLLIGATGAGAATTSATPGGVIHVAAVSYNGGVNHFVITGAFADAGHDQKLSANTSKVTLSRGSFEVDTAQLNKAANNAFNKLSIAANCSFFVKVTGPVTVIGGTGAYTGMTGTLKITVTEVAVFPTKANGQCNESNSAQPIGQLQTIAGAGTISFK
jgi:hypothetical protein